jgi:hypothetical protein
MDKIVGLLKWRKSYNRNGKNMAPAIYLTRLLMKMSDEGKLRSWEVSQRKFKIFTFLK